MSSKKQTIIKNFEHFKYFYFQFSHNINCCDVIKKNAHSIQVAANQCLYQPKKNKTFSDECRY